MSAPSPKVKKKKKVIKRVRLKSCFQKDCIEAGVDEAGRGCLAGPVVAAAVILPKNYRNKVLRDSKALTPEQREELRHEIIAKAICYGVGECSRDEIDLHNILNASHIAMHRAIAQLSTCPGLLLIDGNRFKPYPDLRHECIIGGDDLYLSIAAASILAKTTRDAHMRQLHIDFPEYLWEKNKGYATREHYEAIEKFGLTDQHRRSFRQERIAV